MLRELKVYHALPLTVCQFPKGRSDSLTSHLLRKCPNVTQEDREWVFDQIQHSPDKTGGIKSSQPRSSLSQSIVQDTAQPELQLHNFQQQSALDTLAEVSRHHLDYSSQRNFADIFQDQRPEPINEQAIIAQLREGGLSIPVSAVESENIYLYTTESEHNQAQQTGEATFPTSTFAASPLVQTASAANQQLEQAQTETDESTLVRNNRFVDPQLDDMGAPHRSDAHDSGFQEAHAMDWDPTHIGQPTFGTLSMQPNGNTTGFGAVPKGPKQKTRAHFNDTRRKEVQEIRKRGACLRCRMLKKPCSGETPCSTCRSVESARLWKGKCLRTRVADEFGLWSTNLFYTRAKIEVPAAVHGLEQQALPGRIEARFFTGSDLCVSFAVKAYGETKTGVDPDMHDSPSENANGSPRIWLLDEGDSMVEKLESYVARVTESLASSEQSDFMRVTLLRAVSLIQAEEIAQDSKTIETSEQKSPRSCYSLQNQLLKNVVELWVHTRLLASPETYSIQLNYNASQMPRHLPDEVDWVGADGARSTGNIPSSSRSYQLIRSQLLAAVESRCSKLSKTVMNELERRLLQRQQVSRFATFLSSVILLNAVELMTGLYRSFEDGDPNNSYGSLPGKENLSNSGMNGKLGAAWGDMSYQATDHPYFWPLDTPPSALWPQGPHFADLLTMLLRMRALPPKTCQTSEGALAALQDYSLPVHVNGRPVREQIDDQTKTAAEWLDPPKLKVNELVQKRDGPLPGKNDRVEEWEMRFVSKVLLPERIR